MRDFEEAKDKVLMGAERKSMIISERGEAHHRLPRGRPRAGRQAAARRGPGAQGHHHPARPRARPHPAAARRGSPQHDSQGFAREPHRHLPGRPHRRGDRVRPDDHRRRQRHRAGDRARPQDGLRVGHEREDGPASPSASKEEQSSSAATWRAPGQLLGGHRARHRRRGQAHRDGRLRARPTRRCASNVEQLKRIAEALLEYETIDGEDIDTVLRRRQDRAPSAAGGPPARGRGREGEAAVDLRPPAGSEGRARKSLVAA